MDASRLFIQPEIVTIENERKVIKRICKKIQCSYDQLRSSLNVANCNLISVIIDPLAWFYVSILATSIMVTAYMLDTLAIRMALFWLISIETNIAGMVGKLKNLISSVFISAHLCQLFLSSSFFSAAVNLCLCLLLSSSTGNNNNHFLRVIKLQ